MAGRTQRAGGSTATWLALVLVAACGGGGQGSTSVEPSNPGGVGDPTYDLDGLGVPQFVTTNYIGLAGLTRISLFRSHDGHDYSDRVERCRSMKHYFKVPNAATVVRSPVAGTVQRSFEEPPRGMQIQIRSDAQPAFTFIIFHVTPTTSVTPGTRYAEGQVLGTHVDAPTFSDIAVEVRTPSGRRLVSYFETLTDAAFAPFQARGIPTRETLIISRAQRDAAPLACTGETFTPESVLADPYPIDTAF